MASRKYPELNPKELSPELIAAHAAGLPMSTVMVKFWPKLKGKDESESAADKEEFKAAQQAFSVTVNQIRKAVETNLKKRKLSDDQVAEVIARTFPKFRNPSGIADAVDDMMDEFMGGLVDESVDEEVEDEVIA